MILFGMKRVFALSAFIFLSLLAHAQTLQDTLARIDKLFSIYKPQNPGCQLAICRNGAVIYSKAWGMADLEHQVPLTTGSVIEAGSVSKQFTAAAILLLAQQGKLSLDDDIRKYLPEMPDYGTVIRIRHLLHHTSGLRDWGSIVAITGWPRTTKTYSNDDVLYILSHQKTLNNKPGDEFIYSNSNFNLLALIVKRVTGMELAEFTRQYIFIPAGMMHTQWRDDFNRIVLNRAIAYAKRDTGYETYMPNEYAYGHGGLITTAEDLLKWNEYYWNGKLGNPSLLSQQIAVDHLNNGMVNPYGAGLFIRRRRGWDYIWHDGATAGYRAYLLRYPQLKLSIAYLRNESDIDFALIHKVEDLFVPDREKPAPQIVEPAATYKPSVSQLNTFTGWFRNQKNGAGIELTLVNDTLHSAHYKLLPTGRGVFSAGNQRVIFKGKDFILITAATDTTVYVSVKPPKKGEAYLKDYTGKYYSPETESKCAVMIKDGQLVLHLDPVTDIELKPTYYDGFSMADGSGDLYFIRDVRGKITGYKISVGSVVNIARNIEFDKIK
jgi:CubicO group peptidase (beta-lactamase class C family)